MSVVVRMRTDFTGMLRGRLLSLDAGDEVQILEADAAKWIRNGMAEGTGVTPTPGPVEEPAEEPAPTKQRSRKSA